MFLRSRGITTRETVTRAVGVREYDTRVNSLESLRVPAAYGVRLGVGVRGGPGSSGYLGVGEGAGVLLGVALGLGVGDALGLGLGVGVGVRVGVGVFKFVLPLKFKFKFGMVRFMFGK